MKKQFKSLAALLCLAIVIGLFAGIYFATRPEPSSGSKHFAVQVIHGDGSTKEFSYQSDEEYLGVFLLEEGLIEGDEGQFGLYILAVDGEEALYERDKAYWAFYENDSYANQGVDLTPITDGNRYAFIYTHG